MPCAATTAVGNRAAEALISRPPVGGLERQESHCHQGPASWPAAHCRWGPERGGTMEKRGGGWCTPGAGVRGRGHRWTSRSPGDKGGRFPSGKNAEQDPEAPPRGGPRPAPGVQGSRTSPGTVARAGPSRPGPRASRSGPTAHSTPTRGHGSRTVGTGRNYQCLLHRNELKILICGFISG